jgi:hypothetical protein
MKNTIINLDSINLKEYRVVAKTKSQETVDFISEILLLARIEVYILWRHTKGTFEVLVRAGHLNRSHRVIKAATSYIEYNSVSAAHHLLYKKN